MTARSVIPLLLPFLLSYPASAAPADTEEAVFFETKIRPVLASQCYSCHSRQAKKSRGGLHVDSRAALLQGGDRGPAVVPGKPAESLLLAALRHEGDVKMPPRRKLSRAVIADFTHWIERGAPTPAERTTSEGRLPWSFQPLRRPAVPVVKNTAWPHNAIDRFILARLEAESLRPAERADRTTLLRRASFDLLGLPPTPEEVHAFVKDPSPGAFERVAERLLASPHHGERWGRHWLDVVRYADSAGYEIDNFYEHAWIYRDYVIRSFNADKPFDRFIQEQLAGDVLWPDSQEARIGTGFCTVGPYAYEGGIQRPEVVEYQRLTDLADTVGAAFLGLTVGCARCHDHKFDPISQQDYFGLQAVFAASQPTKMTLGHIDDPQAAVMMVLAPSGKKPVTRLLRRGELDMPQQVVRPSLPHALTGGGELPAREEKTDQRRAALARWLTAADNPLTARVLANRVWQWHFGQGLVRTPEDFGSQGEPPSHPELLDWLACELIEHHWSLKHLHRVILHSATYQMAGRGDADSVRRDPDGRLLSRFPRRRLEAEVLWDNLHAVAGTINLRQFGPAVFPPVEKEAVEAKLNIKWEAEKYRSQWTRRGVYMVVRRSLLLPFFETFNIPQSVVSTARRDTTVVAPQALELLNGPLVRQQAQAFAGRLLLECGNHPEQLVERAWLLAFGRPAGSEEKAHTLAFLALAERSRQSEGSDRKPLLPLGAPTGLHVAPERAAALVELCLALLNSNEFLYVD